MNSNACAKCRFFFPLSVGVGDCRLRPPAASLQGLAQFPQVQQDWWCGAFKEDGQRLKERHEQAENWDRHLDKHTKGVLA